MKRIETSNLKGVFDYIGREQLIRNGIMDTLKNNFEKYGYSPAETSLLYNYDILAYKYDDDAEILNEIYTLSDQGNRNLGLRYDLTIPFCKVIANEKNIHLPFKRYEMGKVFRNGPVKQGRNREFYQCDIDVVGIDNRYIEIEQMQLVLNVFDDLGINIKIKWNNRKLMSGLIVEAGIGVDDVDNCIGILDKKEKITEEELVLEFRKLNISESIITRLLDLFSLSLDEYNNMFSKTSNNLIVDGLNEINEINNYLEELDIKNKTVFTPTLARGLSIYTGIVFEFFDEDKRLTCSLGGGGRYNKIITEFIDDGNVYPAVGLSFGLEPIYTILKENMLSSSLVDVYIIPMSTEIKCLSIANELRNNNIKVEVEMNQRKVKRCFEYASKENVKYVMVIGTNEIEKGLYSLKNMTTGIQEEKTVLEIIGIIKENI